MLFISSSFNVMQLTLLQPVHMYLGAGGRVGTGSSLGAYVRKMAAIDVVKDQDPREALLKYAKVGRAVHVLLALVFISCLEGCCVCL